MVICSNRAGEPTARVMSPEVSMVTPCFSARGRSVSAACSAIRDRSTCSRAKDRWPTRLSSSIASVRSIARALTARRRSSSSPLSRSGSLRATSRRVCVIASGVRSSWEALAANLCCSATCASNCAEHGVEGVGEFAELISAARQPDPVGERPVRSRACGVRDASQGGEHAAGEDPPTHETEHQQEHQHCESCLAEGLLAGGAAWKERSANARSRGSDDRNVGEVLHEDSPQGEQQGTCEHEEPGVAEREFEANTQTRCPIHGLLPQVRRRVPCRCGSRRRPPWR